MSAPQTIVQPSETTKSNNLMGKAIVVGETMDMPRDVVTERPRCRSPQMAVAKQNPSRMLPQLAYNERRSHNRDAQALASFLIPRYPARNRSA